MLDMQDLKDHIDARLDRIEQAQDRVESKIEGHADRITKVETEVGWVKGSIRWSLTLIVTLVGSLLTWLIRKG